jgi:hypothetical protein
MTSSSSLVPNSFSRVDAEAVFISPCAPCLVDLSVHSLIMSRFSREVFYVKDSSFDIAESCGRNG